MKFIILPLILKFAITNGLSNSKTSLDSLFHGRIGNIIHWETYQTDKAETQCIKQWNHYINILKEGSYFPNSTWALKSKIHLEIFF